MHCIFFDLFGERNTHIFCSNNRVFQNENAMKSLRCRNFMIYLHLITIFNINILNISPIQIFGEKEERILRRSLSLQHSNSLSFYIHVD